MIVDLTSVPATWISLAKFCLPRKNRLTPELGLPSLTLRCEGRTINAKALEQYVGVCQLSKHRLMPILYPQVLVSPLQLSLLSRKEFPLNMLGAVHTRNQVVQFEPMSLDARFDTQVEIMEWRLLEKGLEFDLLNRLSRGDTVLWESTSTYFVKGAFGPAGRSDSDRKHGFKPLGITELEDPIEWHLSSDKGRKYARVTGDYNPIHVSRYAAKLLGFQRNLAHGLCVLATLLDKADAANPEVIEERLSNENSTIVVDAEFKGPNYLDTDLRVYQRRMDTQTRLDLYCGDNHRPTMLARVNWQ